MIRLMTLIVLVSGGVLGASVVLAGTPDGMTPAQEVACNIDRGTNYFGLCNAYCEAMDCDSASPNASARACAATHANYLKKSGGLVPPCEAACPCVDRVDAVTAAIQGPVDGFAFPCLDILTPGDEFDPLVIACGDGFDCENDGVGNFVAIGTNSQNGVSFCGGNLDGQDPAFFGITPAQMQSCRLGLEAGPLGLGEVAGVDICAPVP